MRNPADWSTQVADPVAPEADSAPDRRPTLRILAGDAQTAALSMTAHGFPMATFEPISVELRDDAGAVLAGEPVAWSVGETPGAMGVQMDPHGASPCITVTDEHGVATLDRMRGAAVSAFYDHGPFTIIARHASASVVAHLEVAEPAVLRPTIVSGDNQSVARTGSRVPGGEAAFAPVRILLQDTHGQVAPGVRVRFEAIGTGSMSVRISSEGSTAEAVSDAAGIVTLDQMGGFSAVCSGRDGEFKIIATPDETKSVVSHHTVSPASA
jgi:hypothetical protein